jgi:hypothetical protein
MAIAQRLRASAETAASKGNKGEPGFAFCGFGRATAEWITWPCALSDSGERREF